MTDYTDPRYLASRLLIDYENPRPRYQDTDIQAVINYLQRCPTPAQIEAAREALREAIPYLPDEERESVADRCRAALAGLEGR